MVALLQQLNSRVAALADLATKTAEPAGLDKFQATSSSKDATAVTSAGAGSGSIDLRVDRLAQSQVAVSGRMASWPADIPALSVVVGGQAHEFPTDGATLDQVVSRINTAGIGVSAVKVAAGEDANGQTLYRLQFGSDQTGTAGAFTVRQGSAAEVTAGTAPDYLSSANGGVTIRTAQDAAATLWAGTAAENQVTSASNTFTGLRPGVDVSVSAVSTEPTTITVTRDKEATTKVAEDLVKKLDELFSFISGNSTVVTSESGGATKVTGGFFTGNSGIRDIEQRLLAAATGPVNGKSPSEIGISITRTGTVEFDAKKFAAVLAEDPSRIDAVVGEIAARLADVANNVSDKHDGGLTLRIQGQESEVGRLNDQVTDWDRRLELRRGTLDAKWLNLELQLSKLQSQGSWLTSQLGALPGMSGQD